MQQFPLRGRIIQPQAIPQPQQPARASGQYAPQTWKPHNKYTAAIVRVGRGNGIASGVQVGPGWILSCAHVVPEGGYVNWFDGEIAPASIVAIDHREDWVILRTKSRPDIYSYRMRDNRPVKRGDELSVVGFPMGKYAAVNIRAIGAFGSSWTATPGVIPGYSGAPALREGEVFGLAAGYVTSDASRNSTGPSIMQIRRAVPNVIRQIEEERNEVANNRNRVDGNPNAPVGRGGAIVPPGMLPITGD